MRTAHMAGAVAETCVELVFPRYFARIVPRNIPTNRPASDPQLSVASGQAEHKSTDVIEHKGSE